MFNILQIFHKFIYKFSFCKLVAFVYKIKSIKNTLWME